MEFLCGSHSLFLHLLTVLIVSGVTCCMRSKTYTVLHVDATMSVFLNETEGNLHHFWESSGFCPPMPHQNASDWFLGNDMRHNLAIIGAIPQRGIKQIRIHWLFDTIKVHSFVDGKPVYNFTHLDSFMDQLRQEQLQPGFELMGNPSNIFTDFEDRTQVYLWMDLVRQVAQRYVDKYGLATVSLWNFETWNEPRKNGDFDSLNMTLQGLLNYYDACLEGLTRVSSTLRLGGPGGECHDFNLNKSYCWALLDHTQNGVNYFTQQTGTRIDYVAFHKKGAEPNNTDVLFEKEIDTIRTMKQHFPGLSTTPIFNDEGDPLVGWSKPKWWRADATYAVMVTKIIVKHQNDWLSNPDVDINYRLLSNDNGFLSYRPDFFTQRTLLARFQMNNTHPPHVQYIRKPVYTVMGLLALLGDTQIRTTVKGSHDSDAFSMVASVHEPDTSRQNDSWQLAALIHNSMDSSNVTGIMKFRLKLEEFHQERYTEIKWVVYQVDNLNTNPYKTWISLGQPQTPTRQQLSQMRKHEGPERILGPETFDGSKLATKTWNLPLPGVMLLHWCSKPNAAPDQVAGLHLLNITAGQVLIVWDDSTVGTKCILTFEVEYAPSMEGPFTRINEEDIIFNLYVFAPDPTQHTNGSPDDLVEGYYRVRAVDYWRRPGAYSTVVNYHH